MTRQDFDALVRRIEGRYDGRQAALEGVIGRWVALGLAALLSWIAVVTGAGLLLFAVGAMAEPPLGVALILIGVALTVFGVLQAACLLQVDPSPPSGHRVALGEAPALAAMLEGLQRELQCRGFDEVRITLDFNASVREVPRLGLLGWHRTTLEVGLPLAESMSPEELKAVLAHEFVHLSARHGRGVQRIYRLNRTWGNLFERMRRPAGDEFTKLLRSAISRFVDWYWPRLHARSLVLSRVHEFQADRDAARVAGGRALATALWRIEGLSILLSDRVWPEVLAEAAESPEPPADIARRLTAAIRTPPDPADAAPWVERGLARATLRDETHPALRDRVRPLGLTADDLRGIGFPAAARPSAAEALLGGLVPAIERTLSDAWLVENRGAWRDRHRRAASDTRRKAAASLPATPDALAAAADVHGLWEAAREVASLQGVACAVLALRDVLDRDPGHDGAAVVLGRHLAIAGDPEGEAMLHRVLARNDEAWVPPACEALQDVYRASGRADLLREVQARLDRHESDLRAARLERARVVAGDPFLPHGLTDDQLAPLLALLASVAGVDDAWLIRKALRYFPARPLFVLCIRATRSRWWSRDAEEEGRLVRGLVPKVDLPGQVLVIARGGAFRDLARRCMKPPDSLVFRRGDPPR